MAQEVEHILGKDEVTSSSLVSSSTKKHDGKRRVFLMCAKFFAHICTISSKLRVEPVVCARRSRILRALIAFSCRQQLIKYRLFTTKTSCFLMCAKFFAHICTISSKLRVEPVVCARRLRILRALIAFSCRQQLYNNKRISFTDFSFHFSMK